MKKLLVICGSTATGKTKLALWLGKKFNAELVSADSRQVYKWMNIGTGKDLPKNVKFQISNVKCFGERICYYTINGIKLWGYDLVEPKEEFSVGRYVEIANKVIKNIWSRDKLPILVGGTGLYIKGVVDGIPTAKIPKNESLRESLKEKSPRELFEILAQVNPVRAASMNVSDKKNPRRLVRAIEIASAKFKIQMSLRVRGSEVETLFIGLTSTKSSLDKRIEKRVDDRVKKGIEDEIDSLFRKGVTLKHQSMQALGYRQWQEYFEKFESKSGWENRNAEMQKKLESAERLKVIEKWKMAERQYAKRQMTWFKKDKRIIWFDTSKKNWPKNVEILVSRWYSSGKNNYQ